MREIFTGVTGDRLCMEDIDNLCGALGCRVDYQCKHEMGKPQAGHLVGRIVLWGEYTDEQVAGILQNKGIKTRTIVGVEEAKRCGAQI
jgi:hypothetical protein